MLWKHYYYNRGSFWNWPQRQKGCSSNLLTYMFKFTTFHSTTSLLRPAGWTMGGKRLKYFLTHFILWNCTFGTSVLTAKSSLTVEKSWVFSLSFSVNGTQKFFSSFYHDKCVLSCCGVQNTVQDRRVFPSVVVVLVFLLQRISKIVVSHWSWSINVCFKGELQGGVVLFRVLHWLLGERTPTLGSILGFQRVH